MQFACNLMRSTWKRMSNACTSTRFALKDRNQPEGVGFIDLTQLEERILYSASPLGLEAQEVPDINDLEFSTDAGDNFSSLFDAVDELQQFHAQSFDPDDSFIQPAPFDVATNEVASLELVFVDSGVGDYEVLLDDLIGPNASGRNFEIVVLQGDHDGIGQITRTLSSYQDVDAIHILSHGTNGQIKLGDSWLNNGNVNEHSTDLSSWRQSLAAGADLLIYGCNLAGSDEGQLFVEALHEITGADVAASVDMTGHETLGGNWELEYSAGVTETGVAIGSTAQLEWLGKLAVITVTTTTDVVDAGDGLTSLREAITEANATSGLDEIHFNIADNDPGHFYYQDDSTPDALSSIANTILSDGMIVDFDPDYPYAQHSWFSIDLNNALPQLEIADPVIINGFTQAGATQNTLSVGNDAALRIELTSSGADNNRGLTVQAGGAGSSILGLVVNGFDYSGILTESGAGNVTVQGNFVGTDVTGTIERENGDDGVHLRSSGNLIGGPNAADRNVLSGNDSRGISTFTSGSIQTGNVVRNNYIGVDATGVQALGNSFSGVQIYNNDGLQLLDNVIAANAGDGVWMRNSSSVINTIIQGNLIGVGADGTTALGNSNAGIWVDEAVSNTTIGGILTGEGNTIANNATDGIALDTGTGTSIRGNAIFNNGELGIDLIGIDGVNNNDAGDSDSGPNNLQNFPVLTTATISGTNLTITGSLNSNSGVSFDFDFFASATADASGHGEAERFLGSVPGISTDGSGNLTLNEVLGGVSVSAGEFITATATDQNGNTSEFSLNVAATSANAGPPTDIDPNSFSVNENINTTGGYSVGTLTTTDPDIGETFTYSIQGGTDQLNFSIGGASSDELILTDGVLDYDRQATYSVLVQVTDSGGNTYDETLTVRVIANNKIWFSTIDNGSAGGASWNDTQAVQLGGPGFTLEPTTGTTAGTLSLTGFSAPVDIRGMHMVRTNITVGGTLLSAGDLLVTLDPKGLPGDEYDFGSFTADRHDILRFTPGTPGDYSTGTYEMLLDEGIHDSGGSFFNVHAFSLIEEQVTVGSTVLNVGDFVLARSNSSLHDDLYRISVSSTGFGSTVTSDMELLLNGSGGTTNTGFDDFQIQGLSVVDRDLNIGDTFLNAGTILVALNTSGTEVVADNNLSIQGEDIFYLTVSQTEPTATIANATLLMEGADLGLNSPSSDEENINGLTLVGNVLTTNSAPTDLSPNSLDINENIDTTGGRSVATLTTTDADVGDTFTYSILSGGDAGSFSIGGVSNDELILDDGILDYESQATYSVNVRVTDSAFNTYDETITVNVNDITDILVVDTTSDDSDGDVSSIAGLLAFMGIDGKISLREAIEATNADTGSVTPDEIHFAIAGGGVQTISLTAALPFITDTVVIDGYTQALATANTLAVGNDANLLIQLDGTFAGGAGLVLNSDGNEIRGLVINRFSGSGISISAGSDNNTIAGNFIGVSTSGTLDRGNAVNGITIQSSGNTIGGSTAADRNVISGNNVNGIVLTGVGVDNNLVYGNYIGTSASGTSDLGNTTDGIVISSGASNNQVGGNVAGRGNLISGNNNDGIHIRDAATTGNIVAGNLIGLTADGTAKLGNSSAGVRINSASGNNSVGGSTAAARNVISGNAGQGILISGNADDNTITGNYIGTDTTGLIALGNSNNGISVDDSAGTIIGGTTPGMGNVVAGNGDEGINIKGSQSNGTQILGNFIGAGSDGVTRLNNREGIWIEDAPNTIVGGSSTTAANVIGALNSGIIISGDDSTGTQILGNHIGADASGSINLGGSFYGILMFNLDSTPLIPIGNPANSTIGGIAAGEANTIANWSRDGVNVGYGTGHTIRGNVIRDNGGLGINLGFGSNVSANDVGDGDSGANNLQNTPELLTAKRSGVDIVVAGTFNSTGNSSFEIDFYASVIPNASSYGSADRYLDSISVVTDVSGNYTISTTLLGVSVAAGEYVTATATDSSGNTSEFALNVAATAANSPPTDISPDSFEIDEFTDTTSGISLGKLTATDPDAGENFSFSVRPGGDAALFTIGGGDSNELILTSGILDFETNPIFSVTIRVTDKDFNTFDDTIVVNVNDLNDAPVVTLTPVVANLDEDVDTSAPIVVATINVTDDALGSYALSLTGLDAGLFEISGTDLRLVAGAALDFETNDSLDVTVNVDDISVGGTPDSFASHSITIGDINEAPTDIAPNSVSVANGTDTTGGISLTTLTSLDPDAGETFTYTILPGGDGGRFTIGGAGNDELIFADGIMDFFVKNLYTVNVRVTDSGGNQYDEMISVNVSSSNLPPTAIVPSAFSINENIDTSSGVSLGVLTATDPNIGDTFTYTIRGGTDQARFSIGGAGNDELILTAGTLDYENKASYSVVVRVTDSGGNTFDEAISVNVDNLNEPPTSITPDTFNIDENINTTGGRNLGRFNTDDGDMPLPSGPPFLMPLVPTETYTYTIVGGTDQANFSIGGPQNDALIMDDGTLNFESQSSYSVVVRVTDSGGNTYDETITINVNDLNESPTAISPTSFNINENLDSTSGLGVGTLNTTDPDSGDSFTYSVFGGADASVFSMGGPGGDELVLTDGVIDFEFKSSYSAIIRVTDGGGNTFDETITVTVNDVNEGATVSLLPVLTTLAENTDTTSSIKIADIVVVDDALGTNTLQLTGTDASFFIIVGGNELHLAAGANLDFESQPVLNVMVAVNDLAVAGTPDDLAALGLAILDVNEQAIAANDSYTVYGSSANTVSPGVLVNDVDPERAPLTIFVVTPPAHGTLSLNPDGSFTYVSEKGFSGLDVFTYQIDDGVTGPSQATVSLNVLAPIITPSIPPGHTSEPETEDSSEDSSEETDDPDAESDEVLAQLPGNTAPNRLVSGEPVDGSKLDDGLADRMETKPVISEDSIQMLPIVTSPGPDLDTRKTSAKTTETTTSSLGHVHTVSTAFINVMNDLRDEVERDGLFSHIAVGSTVAVSTSLSIGYVIWLIRGGVLMSSVLSALPAWQMVDPLPVLGTLSDGTEEDEDDSLESLVKKSNSGQTPEVQK